MKNLKNTKEPSEFVYFDIISEENMKTIMAHDYDVQVGEDYSMLINALEDCSFQAVFDKFLSNSKKDTGSNGAQADQESKKDWKV